MVRGRCWGGYGGGLGLLGLGVRRMCKRWVGEGDLPGGTWRSGWLDIALRWLSAFPLSLGVICAQADAQLKLCHEHRNGKPFKSARQPSPTSSRVILLESSAKPLPSLEVKVGGCKRSPAIR